MLSGLPLGYPEVIKVLGCSFLSFPGVSQHKFKTRDQAGLAEANKQTSNRQTFDYQELYSRTSIIVSRKVSFEVLKIGRSILYCTWCTCTSDTPSSEKNFKSNDRTWQNIQKNMITVQMYTIYTVYVQSTSRSPMVSSDAPSSSLLSSSPSYP